MTRQSDIQTFLTSAGLKDPKVSPLAGDASSRRYWRVAHTGTSYVLMDAPRESGLDIGPYLGVALHLRNYGYSAPEVLAHDTASGFVLMEDLGDSLYARLLANTRDAELPIYEAAVDVLIDLAQQEPPVSTEPYDADEMAQKSALAGKWYAGRSEVSHFIWENLKPLLIEAEQAPQTLVLRDYHAENLIWLPDRTGLKRVGLLDFQDAMVGPVGYDLISLLEDARRDVSPSIKAPLVDRYTCGTGLDLETMLRLNALLTVQRSLRILGVFARLSLYFSKPNYVDLIPRVWAQMTRALEHPVHSSFRAGLMDALPVPNTAHLSDLRARCGTIRTL